jgi:RNA polymerase sigma factor (sigma-70 family)
MEISPDDEKEDFDSPSIVKEEIDRLKDKDEDRAALYKRLRHYTAWRIRWIPDLDPEDLIQDAIVAAYFGKRLRRKGITLETFLIEIINSKANHWWEKETILLPEEETADASQEATKPRRTRRQQVVEDIGEPIRKVPYSPQPNAAQLEVECEEIFDEMCKIIGDRDIKILKLLKEEMEPKEIAERLGISIGEVLNAKRRIKRKLKDVRKEWLNVKDR